MKYKIYDKLNKEYLSASEYCVNQYGDVMTTKGLVLMNQDDFEIQYYKDEIIDEETPYLIETKEIKIRKYNPNYGDDRICECGHPYYRHFDSYEDMETCGCKYCGCFNFVEVKK